MTKFNFPNYIEKLLAALERHGFEVYVVGGAVRDLLRGAVPHDYDVATSALPEQTLEVCETEGWRTVDKLGHNFGCVVAVIDDVPCEITTFRGERYGMEDAHRPQEIWYCRELREDLSRRDFTVNAMALDASGKLYDFFGGREDLQRGILRTVGEPCRRYREDALRMFRACRFVAQLGFTYVEEEHTRPGFGMENTPYYLPTNFHWPLEACAQLSLERVRAELEKLLTGTYAGKGLMLLVATGLSDCSCRIKEKGSYREIPLLPELRHLVGLEQNPRFHQYDVWEHTLLAVDNSPGELSIRWAMLLHDVGKGLPGVRGTTADGFPNDHGHEAASAELAQSIIERLHYPEKLCQQVVWLVAKHMRFAPILFYKHLKDDPQYTDPVHIQATILKWIRSEATGGHFRTQLDLVAALRDLKSVYLADMGATHAGKNAFLMREGEELADLTIGLAQTCMPVAPGDLAVSGRDLLELLPQEKLKTMFAYLLERVQNQNLPNERECLLQAVRKKLRRG